MPYIFIVPLQGYVFGFGTGMEGCAFLGMGDAILQTA